MYDLNVPDEIPPDAAGAPESPPYVDPADELRARLQTITPDLFVTKILVAMNVAIFLAMIAGGISPINPTIDNLIHWGADYGPRTIAHGEWWRLGMAMFLHIGIIHLAFNMFVLWQAGPFVERLLGNAGFTIVYLVSGLAGSLVSVAWNPYVVSAGASGAIFGLYGALLGFLVIHRDADLAEVLLPVKNSALIFIGYNIVFGFIRAGTDVAAHLGGLAAGFICGLAMSVPLTVEPPPRRDIRNAAVAVAAIALFIGAAVLLPRPVDVQAEMALFTTVEKNAVDTYNATVRRAQMEHLRDPQVADLIEKNVLPGWAAEHDRLARLKGLTGPPQRVVSRLLKYMEMRQQSWQMLVQSLRQHDIAGVRRAMQMQREAEQAARQAIPQNH